MDDSNIYTNTEYLEFSKGTWGREDSPWKAAQVLRMITKHDLRPTLICEVGCGSGVVLQELSAHPRLHGARFEGFDISLHAIAIANELEHSNDVHFHHGDPLRDHSEKFDVLLALDVLEHVPDYLGFLEQCQRKAEYKLYHIPLDIHVSSVVRNTFVKGRYTIGHLHYFVADSALDSLRDTGHEIVDYFYTNGAIEVFSEHRTFKRALANVPRWIVAQFSVRLSARLFGGYSLLVLAK